MAGEAAGRLSDGLPPGTLVALALALERFDPRTRSRGRDYVKERRIVEIAIATDAITAAVEGDEIYEVAWRSRDGRWTPSCTCPVRPWCKHAYAVAWSLVRETRPRAAAPAPAPPPSSVRRLLDARAPWERQQALFDLLGPDIYEEFGLHTGDLTDILAEPDAEIVCWRLARLLPEPIPRRLRALEPYRDRPDLAARHAAAMQAALRRELLAWAERPRPVERRLRVVLALQRNAAGRLVLALETRVTSHRLRDEPRSPGQLQQLRTELRAHPWLLPPEEAALLVWLTDGYGYARSLPDLLERFAHSSVIWWSDDVPPEAAACGVVAGSEVRFHPHPARLLPWCTTRDGEPWLELRWVWPDATALAPDALHFQFARDPLGGDGASLVLVDGRFARVIEEPPGALRDRLRQAGGVAVPPEERGPLLSRLAARHPHIAAAIRDHVRFHRVRPVVVLDLQDDGWLALHVLAHDVPGWTPGQSLPAAGLALEYTPPGLWRRTAGIPNRGAVEAIEEVVDGEAHETPEPPGETWLDLPDPLAVEPAVSWLATLDGLKPNRPGADVGSWWLRAAGRRLEAFVDLWDRRPPGIAFFGTERVRRLLTAPRVAARIRVHRSGVDWLSVSAEWDAEGRTLDETDLATLRTATRRFVKLPSSGEWVRREVAVVHDEAARVLADLGLEAGAGEQRVTLWQLAGAAGTTVAALERLGADPETAAAVAEIRRRIAGFAGLPRVDLPVALRGELRPYQRAGLDFLVHAASLGIGAVLADDMGLGKTVQALAWLAHLRATDPAGGPSLVVCPASVVGNWVREAERFVPDLRVLVLARGTERHSLRAEIADHDLVVTNYSLLRRDAEEWARVDLRAAILDEAQNVKNPDAAVTRAAVALRASYRLALTGTPLENRPLDLWSIATFVNPGYLGTRSAFTARFDRPDAPPHSRALLAAKLRPMLLRRLKREVAPELPERIEERRDCDLTPGQRRLYLAELRRSRELVRHLGDAAGGVERNRITILAALTRLRQLCCHPALGEGEAELGSGKFEALFELLEPLLAEGHKVLVFSQFVRCLDLLGAEMVTRGVRYHVLTGATVRRDDVIASFAADPEPCVFLLSLKAGGTGLNLTAASYVVLFDPWWNPAVEAQAIDRTHRIGQDRTVIAYRLVARGTIEERILALQERKAAMVRDVLGEDGFARALTRDDLEYLLGREEQ